MEKISLKNKYRMAIEIVFCASSTIALSFSDKNKLMFSFIAIFIK